MSHLIWIAAAMLAAEVESVRVLIDVGEGSARVEASYRLTAGEAVRFHLRRFKGQEPRLLTEGLELQERDGLAFFDLGPGQDTLTLRYELLGDLRRIPIFVPDAPVAGAVEIRLRGTGDAFAGDLALRDAFPRLERQPDGTLTARPSDLPSFLRLPPPRGRLTVHRVAEAAVVLLVVLATASWLVRRRRAL